MMRAGGYAPYYSAYQRLRLESSRPLDAADATQFKPGTHKVRIEYVEKQGAKWTVELAGAAGRRMRCVWPLRAAPRLEAEFRVQVEMRGECELRVCTDGSLLLVDPDGGVHDVSSVEDAYELCGVWGVRIKRPEAVGFA